MAPHGYRLLEVIAFAVHLNNAGETMVSNKYVRKIIERIDQIKHSVPIPNTSVRIERVLQSKPTRVLHTFIVVEFETNEAANKFKLKCPEEHISLMKLNNHANVNKELIEEAQDGFLDRTDIARDRLGAYF